MLLYGSQFVDKAVGFEGDPDAYARVQANIRLNLHRQWGAHTRAYPVAVVRGSASTAETMTMVSDYAGGSCSGMEVVGRTGCGRLTTKWQVRGYSLPFLLKTVGIPATSETFIKMDVESFECELLPSWMEWFKALDTKPTIRISFHGPNVRNCTDAQYQQITEVVLLFHAVWEGTTRQTAIEPHLFKSRRDFVLTDIHDVD